MQLFTNKDKNKKQNNVFFFLNTKLARIFVVVFKVRVFIVALLNFLTFSTLKNYFIYFTTSFYNISNIKYSIFLLFHLK